MRPATRCRVRPRAAPTASGRWDAARSARFTSWCVMAGEASRLAGGMILVWRSWSIGRSCRIGCSRGSLVAISLAWPRSWRCRGKPGSEGRRDAVRGRRAACRDGHHRDVPRRSASVAGSERVGGSGQLRSSARVRSVGKLSGALSTSFLLFTFHLQDRSGIGPLGAGLTMLPPAVSLIVFSLLGHAPRRGRDGIRHRGAAVHRSQRRHRRRCRDRRRHPARG